ncbi:TPA: hypothetical protein BOS_23948 [Bos taurus]|nr:TPA: hypothetical protein BOS_23948 [Bos taurus]
MVAQLVPLGTTSWELGAEGSRPNSTSRRPQAARSLEGLGVNKAPPARTALADPTPAGERRAPDLLLSRPWQLKAPGGRETPVAASVRTQKTVQRPELRARLPSPPHATPGGEVNCMLPTSR